MDLLNDAVFKTIPLKTGRDDLEYGYFWFQPLPQNTESMLAVSNIL